MSTKDDRNTRPVPGVRHTPDAVPMNSTVHCAAPGPYMVSL
jgi:hypothetical protein